MSSILIIDDSAAQGATLERGIVRCGLGIDAIRRATTAGGARELLAQEDFDIVLCDSSLPDQEGMDLLLEIAATCADTALVLLTCLEQGELLDRAREAGVVTSLRRPFAHGELVDTLKGLLDP
ncbi:MAG TPA: response regulator [Planctomycetota bacterium]|nr:response regulator [Planctomycetota bacterium]